MDTDGFYDSLEESDHDYCENSFDLSEKISSHEKLARPIEEINSPPLDEVVPFYSKNVSRSEIELHKTNSRCSNNVIVQKSKDVRKKKPVKKDKLKSRSYLNMFHAKIGIENNEELSSRATCLDLTPKSYVTCDEYDVNSVCLKSDYASDSRLIESNAPIIDELTTAFKIKKYEYEQGYGSTNQDLAQSLVSLDSKIQSCSEQNVNRSRPIKIDSKISSNISLTKLPEMGKLGPEISIDKLELYRRRQQYGRKVNQTNKIKMLEKTVLQTLQKEIKNSKLHV